MIPLTTAAALAAPLSHAVIIGSNRAGPGQTELSHAVQDADRMAAVLEELGGYDPDRIHILEDPKPADIIATLAAVQAAVAIADGLGQQTALTFYYSGHARASGLSLGEEELSLVDLRANLESIDAGVTLVVLDACQSGAFSEAKGVERASDFSYSSIDQLTTTGTAVIASSTGQELSQESAELGGAYFTHHLVTGLRGAADGDLDGAVTLSEAFRYTYDRTLIDTAVTAIGSQHPTYEIELSGTGDLVLTRPSEASARLVLPRDETGELLIHHLPARTVAAEVHKAAGESLSLALIPGDYAVTLRTGEGLFRCPLLLTEGEDTALSRQGCEAVVAVQSTDKGGDDAPDRHVMIEGTIGLLGTGLSDYTQRLRDFGYRSQFDFISGMTMFTGGIVIQHRPKLAWAISGGSLDRQLWQRQFSDTDDNTQTDSFQWQVNRLGLYPRLQTPIGRGRLIPYLQGGGGPALASTRYNSHGEETLERFLRWHVAGAAGLQVMGKKNRFGFYTQAELIHAPLPINLLEDRHNAGGFNLQIGLRAGS
ncbi:MAG: hypothetical protein ACI8RZ_006773 [Myxococcota bacterium]|jgi:hypothetical protein